MNVLIFIVPAFVLACGAAVLFALSRLAPSTGRQLRNHRVEQPLAHELPYWSLLDDQGAGIAVGVDLTYSTMFRVRGLDVDCIDAEALQQVTDGIHGVLLNLPTGTVVQFLHNTDGDIAGRLGDYRDATLADDGVGQRLIAAKIEHEAESRTLRRSSLVLAVSVPRTTTLTSELPIAFRTKFPALSALEHAERMDQLRGAASNVRRGLAAVGIVAAPLGLAALRQLVYQLLNPTRAEVLPDPFLSAGHTAQSHQRSWSSDQSAREQLLFSGLEERRDRILLDGKLIRVLTLKSLPSMTEPALLEALLVTLPFHCRIHVAVELLDAIESLDDLKRKRDQAHLLATLREKRNQEAEAQEADVAELIDKNLRSSVRMARVALSVVLSVDAASENPGQTLEKQTAEVVRVASSLFGGQLMIDEMGQLDEFLATLPGNARHSRRFLTCTSENAAHLVIPWQPYTGAAQPLVLLHNGRENLVGLDPFDSSLDNPNAFMAGASGAGKSSTTNYLLINLLAAGARALVIDVGGSYRRVIDLFGGDYFAVQLEDSCSLNLFFSHADAFPDDGKIEDRRLQLMMAVVERMVCDHARPELRNVDRSVLARAIEKTYERVVDRTPVLSDLITVFRDMEYDDCEDTEIARSLARSLRVWAEGPAARLVNRPTTIKLTSQCAAFDLKGLEAHGDLQSVVLLILSGMIWNLVMQDQTERKIVVFDEVWRFLDSPSSARLIAELYRTSRKYRCSILSISQSVEDFTESSIAPALVNNSATVYLLKHRRGHELVAEQFRLNEREVSVFRSLEMRRGEYTEALVLYGTNHFLGRVVLTPLEYWIATTHPADLAAEQRMSARMQGASRWRVLSELARAFPHGADAAQAVLPIEEVRHAAM